MSYIYSVTNTCRHGPLTEDKEKGWFKVGMCSTLSC